MEDLESKLKVYGFDYEPTIIKDQIITFNLTSHLHFCILTIHEKSISTNGNQISSPVLKLVHNVITQIHEYPNLRTQTHKYLIDILTDGELFMTIGVTVNKESH